MPPGLAQPCRAGLDRIDLGGDRSERRLGLGLGLRGFPGNRGDHRSPRVNRIFRDQVRTCRLRRRSSRGLRAAVDGDDGGAVWARCEVVVSGELTDTAHPPYAASVAKKCGHRTGEHRRGSGTRPRIEGLLAACARAACVRGVALSRPHTAGQGGGAARGGHETGTECSGRGASVRERERSRRRGERTRGNGESVLRQVVLASRGAFRDHRRLNNPERRGCSWNTSSPS